MQNQYKDQTKVMFSCVLNCTKFIMIQTLGINLAKTPHYAFSSPSWDPMLSSTQMPENATHVKPTSIALLSRSLRVESHAEVFICSLSVGDTS